MCKKPTLSSHVFTSAFRFVSINPNHMTEFLLSWNLKKTWFWEMKVFFWNREFCCEEMPFLVQVMVWSLGMCSAPGWLLLGTSANLPFHTSIPLEMWKNSDNLTPANENRCRNAKGCYCIKCTRTEGSHFSKDFLNVEPASNEGQGQWTEKQLNIVRLRCSSRQQASQSYDLPSFLSACC